MKPKFILIASALLLMTNSVGAQEQKDPSAGAQDQKAPSEQGCPSAKMTGEDKMGHMGRGHHGMMGQGMKRHGMHMRMSMILMDNDGDGALSLEEVQAAHAKIFKVIDADEDGKVTFTEAEMFFRGGSPTSAR
jgi:hypothetical protein